MNAKVGEMMKLLILLSALFGWMQGGVSRSCVVTMGYKTKPNEPYIFADDSGIYADVYGEALARIGCQLKIVRMPKLRIIQKMKKGEIDIYPAFGFTQERASFAFFIPSHIDHRNVLVTRKEYPEITSFEQLIAHRPTLLKEIGGFSPLDGIPAKRFEATGVNIDKKMQLLLRKRIDAFSYKERTINYYLKQHPQVVSQVRIHRNFFPKKIRKHTLGFSRFSPYASDKYNPLFDASLPISEKNLPTILDSKSVAGRFAQSLQEMEEDGTIETIYDRYRIKER